MSKEFKSLGRQKPKKLAKGKLSLYPLDLETAMGAALKTGVAPKTVSIDRRQKPVEKPRDDK
jgi:hypothetical protein